MTRFERRYRKLSAALDRDDLLADAEGPDASPLDLLSADRSTPRFLDFYTAEGLTKALEHYGLFNTLRRRGLCGFEVGVSTQDGQHTMTLRARQRPDQPSALISEMVVRRSRLFPPTLPAALPPLERVYDALVVDWVCLQNPFEGFSHARLRLPGQEAPGLGVGEQVMELLHRVITRLKLDAVVVVAGYLHNAILYATEWPFLDPTHMGRLQALERDLMLGAGLSIAQSTWAVEWGLVRDAATQKPLRWHGEPQLKPRHPSLRDYFKSAAYTKLVFETEVNTHYIIDLDAFEVEWQAHYEQLLEPPEDRRDV
jgi:hypothetical protein